MSGKTCGRHDFSLDPTFYYYFACCPMENIAVLYDPKEEFRFCISCLVKFSTPRSMQIKVSTWVNCRFSMYLEYLFVDSRFEGWNEGEGENNQPHFLQEKRLLLHTNVGASVQHRHGSGIRRLACQPPAGGATVG